MAANASQCMVSGSLAVVLFEARIAAVAPLRFTKQNGGWQITLVRGYHVVGCLWTVIINFGVLFALIWQLIAINPDITTRHVTWAIEGIVASTIVVTMSFSAPAHMRCLITCSNHIGEIKKALKYSSTAWMKNVYKWYYIAWPSFCTIMLVGDYMLTILFMKPQIPAWVKVAYIFFYANYSIMKIGLNIYSLLVTQVRSSFTNINDRLKLLSQEIIIVEKNEVISKNRLYLKENNLFTKVDNYFTQTDKRRVKSATGDITGSDLHHDVVREVKAAYVTACDAVRDVDSSFGLIVMMYLFGIWVHLLHESYYFIVHLRVDSETLVQKTYQIFELIQLFWCFHFIVDLIVIIEPCHSTNVVMGETRKLVSDLMHQTQSPYEPLAVELEQFVKQITINNVLYQPLSVLTMERGLILAALSSITTYLVILVDLN